jgi:hypothetical protein
VADLFSMFKNLFGRFLINFLRVTWQTLLTTSNYLSLLNLSEQHIMSMYQNLHLHFSRSSRKNDREWMTGHRGVSNQWKVKMYTEIIEWSQQRQMRSKPKIFRNKCSF